MKLFFKWAKRIAIFFFVSTIFSVIALKWIPVYFTPLMFIRIVEQIADGETPKLSHHWVPMGEISRNMPQAVVASEDNLFLRHSGFDFKQIKAAKREAEKGRRVRGASTITQQTAKNVFLWPGKSYVRKGFEAYFTLLIEWIWGKERIMEVYLNSIEMGDGIYGVQAVAQENFGTTADKLTKTQAALIAATLPNPRKFSSKNPSKYTRRRQQAILKLMPKVDKIDFKK